MSGYNYSNMKKSILCCLVLVSYCFVQAQVLIKTQLPPVGLVLKSQLWNLSIVNTGSQSLTVQVEMLVTNTSTNQKVFTGTTKMLTLTRGLNRVTPTSASPVSYNVLSPDYNINVNQEGFLPVGIYTVCYNILFVRNDAAERIAEECETVEIEPVRPPMLVFPSDNEKVEQTRPLFNWLPPAPVSLFNKLLYDVVLVEVLPTQSLTDAVQKNIPVYRAQNLFIANLQYPLSLPELKEKKTYAWQVSAKSGNSPIAKSEVWAFTLKQNDIVATTKEDASFYSRLKMDPDASYGLAKGILKYSYVNELNDKEVTIRVFDITKAGQKELLLDASTIGLQFGENFKEMDFTQQGGLADKHLYLLDLVNSQNEHWFLRFEYRKTN